MNRSQIEAIMKNIEEISKHIEVIKQILNATNATIRSEERKAHKWIGDRYIEGIDVTDMASQTFREATEFTGIIISETSDSNMWEVQYCVKGKVKRIDIMSTETVQQIIDTIIGSDTRVFVGQWWVAIENERAAQLGAI